MHYCGHCSLVGEGRMSKPGREQLTSPECIQWKHQAQLSWKHRAMNFLGIGINMATCWVTHTMQKCMMSEFHRAAQWPWVGSGLSWECPHTVKFLIERSQRSRPRQPWMPPFIVRRADSFCSGAWWWWMTLKGWWSTLELCHPAARKHSKCGQKEASVPGNGYRSNYGHRRI